MHCQNNNDNVLLIFIFIIVVILVGITVYQFYTEKFGNVEAMTMRQPIMYQPITQYSNQPSDQYKTQPSDQYPGQSSDQYSDRSSDQYSNRPPMYYQNPGVRPDYDPIMQYDYRKAFDPLIDPTRRVARNELPVFPLKAYIDLPTKGYPDNFNQTGLLILEPDSHKRDRRRSDNDNDNKILRLFSRQEFPGSNRYEYYTLISSGNDLIKIPITNNYRGQRIKELDDDDIIHIEELGKNYRVKLLKYDQPRYYPNIY
ncbi:MAG: hypothetical protein Barrevirus2_5 [Barrevirus sp.]|uniref:Uncharacterized protein n=1 Tax=Barrevirus sp. TaxID=2487763 RepID=A0A3G4ZPM2_9VIRU|nr:MAG: hypothetical protein Barrevirus2_5 [Barrevirus sp.]